MRVPILTVLPPQEPLRASAHNLQMQIEAPMDAPVAAIPLSVEHVRSPDAIELDPHFAAIPIGTAGGPAMSVEEASADNASAFVVRGAIEVAHPDDIPEMVDGHVVYSDPQIEAFLTCANDPPIGNVAALQAALNCAALGGAGLDGDGIAIAIVDGGINLPFLQNALAGQVPRIDPANSWAPPRAQYQPFQAPVGHGTMCAFDALIAAPKATLIDLPVLGGLPGGSTISGTLSAAIQAYSAILSSWAVSFAAGSLGSRYKGLVISNSWGMYTTSWDFPPGHRGRYCDNPRHPFDVIVSSLIAQGVDILFAAGNCGTQCPSAKCNGVTTGTIMGANAHQEVLTLAGCDMNRTRVGYSSAGPSIAGRTQAKPDLTAFTHFAGSNAAGAADTGTSAACPVAAGCVAALRTKAPATTVPPAAMIQMLQTTAVPAQGQAQRDYDHGAGIIAPLAAAQALGVYP